MTARDGGQLGQTYCCSLQSCCPYVAIWEDHRVSLSSAQCVLSHVFIYVSSTFALTSQYTFGYFFSMYINHSKEQQDFNILFVSSTSILKVTLLKKVKKKKEWWDDYGCCRFSTGSLQELKEEKCERKCVLTHNLLDCFSIIVGNIYKHWELCILILMFTKYIGQTASVNPGLFYLHALLTTLL